MASAVGAAGRKRKRAELSSSLSHGINYEVFLSFRGEDTCNTITDHLYHRLANAGIKVFKDDEELGAGEEIGPRLKEVIEQSAISIAVISKNYASSKSCLTEMVHMWECRELKGQIIIPIFYDISPYDVIRQAGDSGRSFEKHEQKGVNPYTIQRWKDVFQNVGGLSGFEQQNIIRGQESQLVEEVLKRVWQVLKNDDQVATDKLVAIDLHVQEMMRKLGVVYIQGQTIKLCGEDVRVVGICGMPGVGKTTLAKVVFNKMHVLFDGCSFLEVKNSGGVEVFQETLIAALLKEKRHPVRSSGDGVKMLSCLFTKMKVLIVLDNVHENEQIEKLAGKLSWFGQGSRIIVTTNKKSVLKGFDFGADKDRAAEVYEVKPMGYQDALQLFRKHAFQGDSPQDVSEYESLSRDTVKAIGGLPMAIVFQAKYLKERKDIKYWESNLKYLEDHPLDKEVEAVFETSYQSLGKSTKEIFLDIACFFIGEDERIPSYMWKACGYCPPLEIEELRDVYFLEDGENNELRMHRLLRDFGRKIVERKVLQERCRIWKFSDARSILEDGQPNAHVEGISLPAGEAGTVSFTCEALGKKSNLRYLRLDGANIEGRSENFLPNLRHLRLDGANIEGKSENLLPNLRWLDWRECHFIPELLNMDLRKLLILDLSRSSVTKDTQVWRQIMEKVNELKVLNLQGCDLLKGSLSYSAITDLEILILEDCTRSPELLSPELLSFISKLESLKSLNLRNCKGVQRLVQQLHHKKYLTELLIDGTDIKEIYIENDSLENLEVLSARDCKMLEDISPFGHLTKLKSLALDGANIDWVSETFEFPPNLERLSLRNCGKLRELPRSIGKLKQLEEMDLSETRITQLPESIEGLSNLKTLKMEHTLLQKFPKDIGKLEKLREIDFSGCTNLEAQDSCDISGLSCLRIFRLSSSIVAGLPQGICDLPCLRTLDVRKCERLQALPELPSSLVTLCGGFKIMEASKLTNLTNLKELCLSDDEQPEAGSSSRSPNIEWITRLTSLETLELSLPNVTNLHGDFRALTRLRELTLSYMEELDLTKLPSSSSLWTLRLKRCTIPEPNFSCLKYLSELELDHCDLAKIDGLENLKLLEVLRISSCYGITNLNGLKDLPRLRKVQGFFSAQPSLPELAKRVELDICVNLEIFPVLDIIQGCGMENLNEFRDVNQPKDGVEAAIESMENLIDEAGLEISDRNCTIATVQNIVGIDDRVKQITDLLEMEVNDEVRIIGIYGTDGIGKTTLAKAVYKRIYSCFNSCSFLAEVEETTQNSQGFQFLQNKLIRDILERDHEDPFFDETIEDFVDIFHEMKVLIVVDAVEKPSDLHAIVGDQLQWFGPGSRIIVTSQNEEILKEFDSDKARNYTVSELDDGQAFESFCKHAFRMQSSIPDYDGLANRIVKATEKLPLAVEVVGSLLRGKSIREWEKMEKSMKQFMMNSQKTTVGLEEILNICYKELDQQQKETFLDIACFISGADARIASYMWPNCYLPSSDCILMPLAKIGENNELQMHRLLRCLGKRILNQEGSGDPIGRKLHTQDMAPKEISGEKGMETVEALCFDFTAGDFQSTPDLRFLKLDNAKLSRDFAVAFPNLRWLCWQRCPRDFDEFNFVLRELVILDLSRSKVTEDWGGQRTIKMEKLKVLNLTGCSDLLITPNFSGCKNLEILILEQCSRLVKLDRSIGHLKHLVSLNLKFCSQLNRLPVELGHMTALKELFIDGTSVREIPISIGNLKQLKILSGFKCCQLTHLPSSISYLTDLSVLSLDGAKISELPSSLGELLNLRRLSLRDCHYMQELPDSIGKMGSSLEELDISATSVSKLPGSMRNLQNLRVLRMDSSFIRAFPVEIGKLTKLEELHASWCRSLKAAIPRDIGRLHHLRSLTVGHSGISSLPSEISTISSLQTLDLLQCNEIEVLPELPSSLICLRVSSKRMKAIPLLKDLKELEELCLSDEDPKECQPPSKRLMQESKVKQLSIWFSRLWNLEFLQTPTIEERSFSISFPKLRKLELSLSRVIKLQFLYEPPDIPQLKTLALSGLSLEEVSELPKTLSVLSIRGCSSLKRLPIVQWLTNLSAFELHHSAIEEIEGLEGLKALRRLDISNCKIQNLNGIGQLTSLRSLILSDCDELSLPDLSNLKSLKVLEIRQCKMIQKIEGLEKLSLEKLNISECPAENSV